MYMHSKLISCLSSCVPFGSLFLCLSFLFACYLFIDLFVIWFKLVICGLSAWCIGDMLISLLHVIVLLLSIKKTGCLFKFT